MKEKGPERALFHRSIRPAIFSRNHFPICPKTLCSQQSFQPRPQGERPWPTPWTPAPSPPPTSNAAPESNDAQVARLKSEHEVQNKFQLDLLELQQDFAADQFWVTTLSAINKSSDETRKEIGRKF